MRIMSTVLLFLIIQAGVELLYGYVPASMDIAASGTVPSEFTLDQNYPNPFNPTTRISFKLPVKSKVSLDVYNLIGQKVRALLNSSLEAGTHYVDFDAKELSSGVYIYTLTASGENGAIFSSYKKMTLIK